MLQRTFEISTREEAARVAETLRGIPEAVSAREALLQVFAFSFTYEETAEMIEPIREAFPNLKVTGLSVYTANPPEIVRDEFIFDNTPMLRMSILFFERSTVRVLSYELDAADPSSVLERIRRELAATPRLKGVRVTISGFFLHVSGLLEKLTEGFEDIPFFGTMADVNFVTGAKSEPFVFDSEREYRHGVIFQLFTGEELHVDAQYIFGWKPIGKSMAITESKNELTMGDTAVATIDGAAPEEIYRKYLGVRFDRFLSLNCCEFPLVVERDGLLLGRTPFTFNENGEVIFIGSIRPNERVRFSYTVRENLLSNTEQHSRSMIEFAPQAIELFVCGNRSIMLRDEAPLELDCFRRIVPDMLHCSAAGEIYYHHGRGAFLNSALVAVGMREGEPREIVARETDIELIRNGRNGAIPLSERILYFLQAMTGDLVGYAHESQRASRAKSAFLANMSHEIRSPINAILGMDEMILRESGESEILEYAKEIESAGKTLLSIINDILDLSKIEEGKMEILPVKYDISSLVNDLVNMTRPRTEDKGLSLDVKVDETLPHLLIGDEIRLRQCALNILTNAAKYTEKGGVTLSVGHEKRDGGRIALRISVRDTGIGMKREDMDRLFAPFARIEEMRNRSIEGTGLGMSITKQLLSLMGSSLEVESVYGEGSTFSFTVDQEVADWEPIGDYAGRVAREEELRSAYRESFRAPEARILAVDDMPVNLTVIKGLLKKTQIVIDTAESGAEALRKVEKQRYDVIFIDHMMPNMDGLETLREMKKLPGTERTVFIALTANAISGSREQYLNAGFSDYMSKPVDGRQLEKLLMERLPPEKVKRAEPERGKAESGGAELPPRLYALDELNAPLGIELCGTVETYLDTLRVFASTSAACADEIESLHAAGDIAGTTVKVHALKSTSRVIGATSLSELAERLEAAGKAGDESALRAELDSLVGRYRALGGALSQALAPEKQDADALPPITGEELRVTYDELRALMSEMEYGRAADMLRSLSEYTLPEGERKRVDQLRRAADDFEWEKLEELLGDAR